MNERGRPVQSEPTKAIVFDSNEPTIQSILDLYDRGQLDLEPGFQRASVWDIKDRSKLIDSILKNYPLPSIFLYQTQRAGDPVYYVIDGKQRIETLLMFTGRRRGQSFVARRVQL